jgi:hypothetical protein
MGGRIGQLAGPVAGLRQHLAIRREHGADRHLAARRRSFRLGKGDCHEVGPAGRVAHSRFSARASAAILL